VHELAPVGSGSHPDTKPVWAAFRSESVGSARERVSGKGEVARRRSRHRRGVFRARPGPAPPATRGGAKQWEGALPQRRLTAPEATSYIAATILIFPSASRLASTALRWRTCRADLRTWVRAT